MKRSSVYVAVAAGLVGAALAEAPAAAQSVEGRYRVTIAGLNVGTATVSGQITDSRYQLTVNAQLSGLAGAVTNGRGAAQSSGIVQGPRVLSNGYALSASNGEVSRTIQIGMATGNVGQYAVVPPFEPRPDRVPVTEAHRRGVQDPVSALIMPMVGGRDPWGAQQCNRMIPVFDGVQRFDVALSFGEVRMLDGKRGGYAGPVLVCNARYTPRAGHRPIPATDFMRNNREMSVWLVPVDGAAALVPYRISVKTMIGTAVIEAESLRGIASEVTASIRR
jgi:hypothetical protein